MSIGPTSEGGGFINLGDLSKPATVLIEKISDAIGGIFRPYQIRRIAQAEGEAEKIRAVSQIEITELQRRAIQRFVVEEAKKQQNIESITQKALPSVEEAASPQNVDDDWITNFFDRCRLVSDDQMQTLWSKVLAGEANKPGSYSKHTVNMLSSLDKTDAELFTTLCGFGWFLGNVVPLVYDVEDPIYNDVGITFNNLTHLDDIGLISFDNIAGYQRLKFPKTIRIFYYGKVFNIEFSQPVDNRLDVGRVLLSKAGQELAAICGSTPRAGFVDYVVGRWQQMGLQVMEESRQHQVEVAP
jgi:Protein of unknown function (DUF2806)